MHPTSTIFENVMERGQRKLPTPLQAAAARDLAARKPFRQTDAAKDALFSSSHIPPYKSGGHLNPKQRKVGEWAPSGAGPYGEQPAEYSRTLNRHCSEPALGVTRLGSVSGVSPAQPGGGDVPLLGSECALPNWVAFQHSASTPSDAAGHGGGRMRRAAAGQTPAWQLQARR